MSPRKNKQQLGKLAKEIITDFFMESFHEKSLTLNLREGQSLSIRFHEGFIVILERIKSDKFHVIVLDEDEYLNQDELVSSIVLEVSCSIYWFLALFLEEHDPSLDVFERRVKIKGPYSLFLELLDALIDRESSFIKACQEKKIVPTSFKETFNHKKKAGILNTSGKSFLDQQDNRFLPRTFINTIRSNSKSSSSSKKEMDKTPKEIKDQHVERFESGVALKLLEKMLLIRYFELEVVKLFNMGFIPSPFLHLYVGQEATAVGVLSNTTFSDYMISTHRNHGHLLAKGANPRVLLAELLGKRSGCCGGKGGSMHLADFSVGAIGGNGIVGASVLLGTGPALASKMLKKHFLTVAFTGDGSINQGMFHEALNLASTWDLPLLIIIENNHKAGYTDFIKHSRARDIARRIQAYDVEFHEIDGNDVISVFNMASKSIKKIKQNNSGSIVIEAITTRLAGHALGLSPRDHDPKNVDDLNELDPIKRYYLYLEKRGWIDFDTYLRTIETISNQLKNIVLSISDDPMPSKKQIQVNVYYPDKILLRLTSEIEEPELEEFGEESTRITMARALNRALREELKRDETVYISGEDVSVGGYFGITRGLVEEFGEERIRDTPISENATLGSAIGSAIVGMRPVVEIMFADFLSVAMDPIVSQAAKLRYMSDGQFKVPLVVRAPSGPLLGAGSQHSQVMASVFGTFPGLLVVAPSTPFDALGLLKTSIRSENPVIFLEHKWLYSSLGQVPMKEYTLPIGKARILAEGTDVTIVAIQGMIPLALEARNELAKKGFSCEVIDPRTLLPLDLKTIRESLEKTGRLLVLEEEPCSATFGANLISTLVEDDFELFKKPPARLGSSWNPVPYSPTLERATFPRVNTIIQKIMKLIG